MKQAVQLIKAGEHHESTHLPLQPIAIVWHGQPSAPRGSPTSSFHSSLLQITTQADGGRCVAFLMSLSKAMVGRWSRQVLLCYGARHLIHLRLWLGWDLMSFQGVWGFHVPPKTYLLSNIGVLKLNGLLGTFLPLLLISPQILSPFFDIHLM